MRNRLGNILWGFFWIALGVIIIGRLFGLWEFTLFFAGWWTLFIIIPCGIGMVKYGFGAGSTIGFILGILLLLTYQMPEYITMSMVWKLVLPIILIVIGLNVVFKALFGFKKELLVKIHNHDKREYASVFSAQRATPTDQFYGCEMNSVFGSTQLDLRNAIIAEDVLINATSIFGSSDIWVPPYVNVKTSATSIFGGTENKVRRNPEATATVYVNTVCLFGGVKVQ